MGLKTCIQLNYVGPTAKVVRSYKQWIKLENHLLLALIRRGYMCYATAVICRVELFLTICPISSRVILYNNL